ncbi:MAG: phosphatase PAP2 family protein [Coriobacteriales bacterium]
MSFDLAILVWIRSTIANPVLDQVVPFITYLGTYGTIWVIAGVVMLCNKKTRRSGLFMLVTILIAWIFGEHIIKPLCMRPRPYVDNPWLLPLIVPEPGGYSFPSGHALISICAATILLFAPIKKPWKVLAWVLAVAIALSRLYLCVHYPTDVLFGALIGAAFGVAGGMLYRRWRLDLLGLIGDWPRVSKRQKLTKLSLPKELSARDRDPLSEHPHPTFARSNVLVLNGAWDFCLVDTADAASCWSSTKPPETYTDEICVPFSPEASASGIGHAVQPDELMWYRKKLDSNEFMAGAHYLLHFEAVDCCCAVYCNGIKAGIHKGGYEPFSLEITDALVEGENEIAVCVWDPNDAETQPRGRQSLEKGGIWHTAQSGIWQPVWLEGVPSNYIKSVELEPSLDDERLSLTIAVAETGQRLDIRVSDDDGAVVSSQSITVTPDRVSDLKVDLFVAHPHPWSPDSPALYSVQLVYGRDLVTTYCAFRTVEIAADDAGAPRLLLNHKPLFLRGVSALGYWPETLMTAPSDAAMLADIGCARELGFNLIRLYDKVESERWYYLCDRSGMLIWQDIVSGGGSMDMWTCAQKPQLSRPHRRSYDDSAPAHYERLGAKDEGYRMAWRQELTSTIERLKCHPSIITWSLFDEGRGQFDSAKACDLASSSDPTRPIDAASGWFDQGSGSYLSVHDFHRPPEVYADRKGEGRAFVLSAFGAKKLAYAGHLSTPTVRVATDREKAAWNDGVCDLIDAAELLEEKGAAGFIFYQLYDVEEETDGLVTFDRKIDKLSGAEISYPEEFLVEGLSSWSMHPDGEDDVAQGSGDEAVDGADESSDVKDSVETDATAETGLSTFDGKDTYDDESEDASAVALSDDEEDEGNEIVGAGAMDASNGSKDHGNEDAAGTSSEDMGSDAKGAIPEDAGEQEEKPSGIEPDVGGTETLEADGTDTDEVKDPEAIQNPESDSEPENEQE